MNKERYLRRVKHRLNLPKAIKNRVMADFESDIAARLEAGSTMQTIQEELGSPRKAAADLNEQMKEYTYRKSSWRYLFVVSAVLSGGWLAFYALLLRFGLLLNMLSVTSYPVPSTSIGIIGGADGPTSVFVTGVSTEGYGLDWDAILIMVVFAVSILAFLRLRRCRQK